MSKITVVIQGQTRLEVSGMASVPSSTFEIRVSQGEKPILLVNDQEVEVEPEVLMEVVKLLTTK